MRGQNPPGKPTRFTRPHNNAGGIEGGVSNGEDIVVRGYLKPISTLRQPLESVRFDTREPTSASYERSDICVVPAAGVAAEAMVALVDRQPGAREIRRRFARGIETEFRRIHRTNTELLAKHDDFEDCEIPGAGTCSSPASR